MVVTCFGASVQVAPLGEAGSSIFQLFASGTNMLKASDLPSGLQRTSATGSVTRVTCEVAPPASMYRTNTCAPRGSPSATYAMRVPSGDHTGLLPFTRKWWRPPVASTTHRADSHRSVSLLT
jgi:hypothetical protein